MKAVTLAAVRTWLARFRWRRGIAQVDERPEIDAAQVIRRARRLRFTTRPGAIAELVGAYRGIRSGEGLTFAELRPYEPGDDVRTIDWNVTARQNRPYVRRFVEERALTLEVLVDVSASMRFGRAGQTKADRAAQTAALLATAAVQSGDRAGLTLISDRVESRVRPAGGMPHLSRILRALVVTPGGSRGTRLDLGFRPGATKKAILPRRDRRRTLTVVLSDFRSQPSREVSLAWARSIGRDDLIVIRVVDRLEEELPRAGLIAVVEAETSVPRWIDTRSNKTQTEYSEAAARRARSFKAWAVQLGLDAFDLRTDEDPIVRLTRAFRARSPRRARVPRLYL